jgi:hypothetical protein
MEPVFDYDVAFSFLANDESVALQINDALKGTLATFLYSEQQKSSQGQMEKLRLILFLGRKADQWWSLAVSCAAAAILPRNFFLTFVVMLHLDEFAFCAPPLAERSSDELFSSPSSCGAAVGGVSKDEGEEKYAKAGFLIVRDGRTDLGFPRDRHLKPKKGKPDLGAASLSSGP